MKLLARRLEVGRRKNQSSVFIIHLKMSLRLSKFLGSGVSKIGRTVVKYKRSVRITEALSMMFVRQATSIPVPKVHNVFTRGAQVYLVMEYIPGTSLEVAWQSMTPDGRRDICSQLAGYIKELRSLKPPHPGAVEAIDGSACKELSGLLGPFKSIDGFHSYFGHDCITGHPEEFPLCQPAFERIAEEKYRTVITHGDPGTYNILVRDGKIVSIIDWEFSGWYPEYREYTSCHNSNSRTRSFLSFLKGGAIMDLLTMSPWVS